MRCEEAGRGPSVLGELCRLVVLGLALAHRDDRHATVALASSPSGPATFRPDRGRNAGVGEKEMRSLGGHETLKTLTICAQRTGERVGQAVRKRRELRAKRRQELENGPWKSLKKLVLQAANSLKSLERATGIEPATFSLGS